MRELSVFVDKSGDFGNYERHNPYYVLVLLFHDQANPISNQVDKLDKHLTDCGLQIRNTHTGPLIRQEDEFFHMSLQTRRSLFRSIAGFTAKCDIAYKAFVIERLAYKASVGGLTKSERLFLNIKSKELKSQIKAVHGRRFFE